MIETSLPKIIVIGDAISSKNGGSASFVELCLNLEAVSNLTVATRLGWLDRFYYGHPDYNRLRGNLYSFSMTTRDDKYRNEKVTTQNINVLTFPKLNKSKISDNNLIIDCYGIDPKKFRSHYGEKIKIVRMHNGSIEAFSKYFGSALNIRDEQSLNRYQKIMNQYDGLIFQTEEQLNEVKNVIKKNIPMVTLTPTANERVLREILTSRPNLKALRLAQIASIQPRKNQLQSFQYLKYLRKYGIDATLKVIGPIEDDEYFKTLTYFAEKNNLLQYISYEGFKKDYTRYYSETDIILIPSKAEGVSRTLREALFLKKPVVALEVEGTRSLIDSKIIMSFDDTLFINSDNNLIQAKLTELVSNGFRYYEEHFSQEKYQNRISKQIELLI